MRPEKVKQRKYKSNLKKVESINKLSKREIGFESQKEHIKEPENQVI